MTVQTETKPKTTANAAAILRARHYAFDDAPKIIEDNYALGLSGIGGKTELAAAVEEMRSVSSDPKYGQTLRGGVVLMRQRLAEDALIAAIERGVDQYVVLGAGLDSFALRYPKLADKVRVFEVDFPATQQWKTDRFAELSIDMPKNLIFVPVDFENQDLGECLAERGLDISRPVFVSWLGTVQFLTDEAIFKTFRYVVSMAPGSEIIFDYFVPESELNERDRAQLVSLKAFASNRDETFGNDGYVPSELARRLRDVGFTEVTDLGPDQIHNLFFANRSDGLSTSRHCHIAHARR